MPENASSGSPPSPDPQARLREVARLLRESASIDPESRRTLAGLLDELGAALAPAALPPGEAAHLAQTAAQLAESLHQRHDRGRLGQARDRLEQAVLAAEARAPVVSGVVHRLMDALANSGI